MARLGPAKLADWFAAYGPALVLYARQVLAEDPASAEDVVQNLFVRLLSQTADGLPAPPNPAAWLHRCVRNACLDERRGRARRRHHESSLAAGRSDWFEAGAGDMVDARLVQDVLATLPDPLRQVVTLRLWSGLTLAEISDVVAQPVSTVHDQYRRALSEIRRAIEARPAESRSRHESYRLK